MASKSEDQASDETIKADMPAIFSGPAFYSNRIFATLQQLGIRLTFMETNPESKQDLFRTAVYLSIPDAMALQQLLGKILEGIELEIKEDPEA
jgi:hypothetical protein